MRQDRIGVEWRGDERREDGRERGAGVSVCLRGVAGGMSG